MAVQLIPRYPSPAPYRRPEPQDAVIPQTVIQEHRRAAEPAVLRLLDLNEQLKAAAAAGNTALIRRLRAEKGQIEEAERRESERRLALIEARKIPAPKSETEGVDLEARAKQLSDTIHEAQSQCEGMLSRLRKNPESDVLLNRVDRLRQEVEDAQAELLEVQARQAQLETFAAQRKRQEEETAALAEWGRDLPANRRRLKAAVRKAIGSYKALKAALTELDTLRDSLRGPRSGADPLIQTYGRLSEATDGALTFNGTQWHLELTSGPRASKNRSTSRKRR